MIRVKEIVSEIPYDGMGLSLEDGINEFFKDKSESIELIDIKYQVRDNDSSALIVYKVKE